MHEVWSTVGHQPNYIVSNDLTIHRLGDVLLHGTEVVRLFSIDGLALSNEDLAKLVSHGLFEFQKDLEKVFSEVRQVLLF